MRVRVAKLIIIWSSLTFLGSAGAAELCPATQIEVKLSKAQAIRTIAKEKAYTEGLVYSNGVLFESVGLKGHSELREIDPYTGIRKTLHKVNTDYFAEGLAEAGGGKMIQLTFQENVAMIYDHGRLEQTVAHPGEGWGLTQLNGELVKSDGSDKLTFLDPRTLEAKRTITVHDNKMKYKMLNELESARGMILANIFGQDWVAMINPVNGCVIGKIGLSQLRLPQTYDRKDALCYALENPTRAMKAKDIKCVREDFATNGIAYDEVKDELYFTGKNWPYIFVFKFPR